MSLVSVMARKRIIIVDSKDLRHLPVLPYYNHKYSHTKTAPLSPHTLLGLVKADCVAILPGNNRGKRHGLESGGDFEAIKLGLQTGQSHGFVARQHRNYPIKPVLSRKTASRTTASRTTASRVTSSRVTSPEQFPLLFPPPLPHQRYRRDRSRAK